MVGAEGPSKKSGVRQNFQKFLSRGRLLFGTGEYVSVVYIYRNIYTAINLVDILNQKLFLFIIIVTFILIRKKTSQVQQIFLGMFI